MLYSFIAHYLSGVIIEKLTKARVVKSNAINDWCCFITWINLPTDMRIEWLCTESVIHKATPIERLCAVYFFVSFFEFSDTFLVVMPFLIAQTCKTALMGQEC